MGSADTSMPQEPLPVHFAPPTAPEIGSDHALARMVERMSSSSPRSGAEALRELRAAFPDAPLALRVAILGILRQHRASSACS